MTGAEFGLSAIGAITGADPVMAAPVSMRAGSIQGPTFMDILADGVGRAEAKVARANELANAFVLDDSIPVHQVTYALEEARLSLELALQVRTRLTEAYQQIMGMQL